MEGSSEGNVISGSFVLRGKITYQLTRSITKRTDDSDQAAIGRQLIYTPVHTGSAMLGSMYKTWSANLFLQYSGKRFTEASNSPIYALDPFALVDFSMAKSWTRQRLSLDLSIMVKNIFDTTYQMYSGHAMPGRNFNIKISYQLKRKTNEHS